MPDLFTDQTDTSLHAQIKEVRRELVMRDRVYPGLVARGKLKQGEADARRAVLTAVLATLETVLKETTG